MDGLTERSRSRSRGLASSGRGGVGNIRESPATPGRPEGPDDFSPTRGREPAVSPEKVFSTGRGGAGNIRSPSRDVPSPHMDPDLARQQELIQEAETEREFVSTGRGGLGNMSRSRSRAKDSRASAEPAEQHKHSGPVSDLIHKVFRPHHADGGEEQPHYHPDSKESLEVSSFDAK